MSRQRVVVVSGGGTGIGKEISRQCAAAGDHVIIIGRREQVLAKATAELSKLSGRVDYVQADLAEVKEVARLITKLEAKGIDHVDVLVTNAGASLARDGTSLSAMAEQYLATFKANVLSAILLTEAVRPKLRSPGGRIIALSSIAAFRGGSNAAYAAAKAALSGWVRSLSLELSAAGITVNAVAPGYIEDTEFFGAGLARETRDWLVSMTPLGRAGTPRDAAGTVLFLASDAAEFITGEIIHVNGGAYYG